MNKWRLSHKQVVGAFIRTVAKGQDFERIKNRRYIAEKGLSFNDFRGPDLIYQRENEFWGFEIKPSYVTILEVERGIGQCAISQVCGLYPYLVLHQETFKERARFLTLMRWLGIIVYSNKLNFTVANEAPGSTFSLTKFFKSLSPDFWIEKAYEDVKQGKEVPIPTIHQLAQSEYEEPLPDF